MPATPQFDAIPPWALANLVASTAEFQRATGTTSEAAALNFIHFLEADDRREGDEDKVHPRPRAIIEWAERLLKKQGTGGLAIETGALALSFEMLRDNLDLHELNGEPTFQDLSLAFMNCYGTILAEMGVNVDLAHDRYLNIQELTLFEGPVQVREREEDFWGVCFTVTWFG